MTATYFLVGDLAASGGDAAHLQYNATYHFAKTATGLVCCDEVISGYAIQRSGTVQCTVILVLLLILPLLSGIFVGGFPKI